MNNTVGIHQLSDDELLHRRRELEAMAHGLMSSGVPMMERDQAEYDALGEEIRRRDSQAKSGQ